MGLLLIGVLASVYVKRRVKLRKQEKAEWRTYTKLDGSEAEEFQKPELAVTNLGISELHGASGIEDGHVWSCVNKLEGIPLGRPEGNAHYTGRSPIEV